MAHPPIVIRGDLDFLNPANGVVGGSGTSDDPYRISGWEIRRELDFTSQPLNNDERSGVYIEQTTAHFIVSNIVVGAGIDWPVKLINAPDGIIEDVVTTDANYGILADHADRLIVRGPAGLPMPIMRIQSSVDVEVGDIVWTTESPGSVLLLGVTGARIHDLAFTDSRITSIGIVISSEILIEDVFLLRGYAPAIFVGNSSKVVVEGVHSTGANLGSLSDPVLLAKVSDKVRFQDGTILDSFLAGIGVIGGEATFANMTISGDLAERQAEVRDGSMTLENVTFLGTALFTIVAFDGGSGQTHLSVSESRFLTAAREGIHSDHAATVTVTDSVFDGPETMVYVSGPGHPRAAANLARNEFHSKGYSGVFIREGTAATVVDNTFFASSAYEEGSTVLAIRHPPSGTQIAGNGFGPNAHVGLTGLVDGKLERNTFTGAFVACTECTSTTFSENRFSGGQAALIAQDSVEASILENRFENTNLSGILMTNGTGAVVDGNVLDGGVGSGLRVSLTRSRISNNTVTNQTEFGLTNDAPWSNLGPITDVEIVGNVFRGNGLDGAKLMGEPTPDAVSGNKITANVFERNGRYGLLLLGTSNLIEGNLFLENGKGTIELLAGSMDNEVRQDVVSSEPPQDKGIPFGHGLAFISPVVSALLARRTSRRSRVAGITPAR